MANNPHNPDQLTRNCVFVTISRLLDKPYGDLIKDLELMEAEEPSEMGITTEILKWWQWKCMEKYHAYVRFYLVEDGNTKTSRKLCEEKTTEWKVPRLGLLYNHAEGGHAICFENDHFLDWQNLQEVTPDPTNPAAILCIDPPK